jgi:nicotinamidase/pyrazinamidase
MNRLLVVVDMQNDFIDGALGTKEAVAIVSKVIEKIRGFDGRVFFTRDTHQEGYLETQEGRSLPVVHCVEGTTGWELQSDIKVLSEQQPFSIFNKETFGSKDLIGELTRLNQEQSIDEIYLVGLCTDICVISNAMTIKTFLPETKLIVDASCCAGVTPESHQRALDAMKMCLIHITNEETN